jgi:hypothetical protein
LSACIHLGKIFAQSYKALTMHKFKKLVDDCFEEFPMGPEKSRILADNVHDIGGDDGLIILASFLLTQAQ